MAKRDLDKEFKEQLGKGGPFQFSENNWKAASAMLEKEMPVATGGRFFNMTTLLLSITVALLLGTTLVLSLEKKTIQEQNTIEMPVSESIKSGVSPDAFEIQDPSADDLKTIENVNKRPIVKSNGAAGPFETASENSSAIDDNRATVYTSSKKSNEENNVTISQSISKISDSENGAGKPQDINLTQTNGITHTSNLGLKQSETGLKSENTTSGQTALPSVAETSAIVALNETAKSKIQNSNANENGSEEHSLNSEDGNAVIESGEKESQQNKTNQTIAGAVLIHESEKNENSAPVFQDSKSSSKESTSLGKTSHSEENLKPMNVQKTTGKEESNPSISDEAKRRNPKNSRYNSNYFRLGFETGLFVTNRTLTTSDLNCEDYITKRNNEESMKPSYSFGLNFGQQIDKLSWQVGLNYSTYQENIAYNNEVLGKEVLDNGYWNQFNSIDTIVRSNWIIDSIFAGHWEFDTTYANSIDSNYVEQWDTSTVVKLDSSIQQNNGIHSLRYFEVPLFLGYTFGKNTWKFDVQPGISIGFLSGSRGSRYIHKNLSGLVEPSAQLEQFNKVIWKAHFRAGVRYTLDQWDFGLYPHYSFSLNNFWNSTIVEQRYGSFGVTLGAYYKF